MRVNWRITSLSLTLLTGASPDALFGQESNPPVTESAKQQIGESIASQKNLRDETAQTARRISTMLRAMSFNQIDAKVEEKLLRETAGTLSKLGRDEMTAVVAHLEEALRAQSADKLTAEQAAAYDRHREVVSNLKGLLFRFDIVKSLDQAAERLEKHAREQLEIELSVNDVQTRLRNPQQQQYDQQRMGFRARMGMNANPFTFELEKQNDVAKDLDTLFAQVDGLKKVLKDEPLERLKKANVKGRGDDMLRRINSVIDQLQNRQSEPAINEQITLAKELQALAQMLKSPKDKLAMLREAKRRLDEAETAEKAIKEDTAKVDEKVPKTPAVREAEKQEVAKKQARTEFETRDVRTQIQKENLNELAETVKRAEEQMKQAREQLKEAKEKTDPSQKSEQAAIDKLEEAKEKIDKLIAAEEAKKNDPTAALKEAIAQLDKVIQDQKETRKNTEQNKDDAKKLPELAKDQKKLEAKADELANKPLPAKPEVTENLKKAEEAMKKAADKLDEKKGDQAKAPQDKAVEKLEQAKKGLEDALKEAEKRKDDIAKLDKAIEKLEQLTKEEKAVAKESKDKAEADPKKGEGEKLAKDQDKIQKETSEVKKDVEKVSPEANDKLKEAGEKMEATKGDLKKDMLEEGAKDGQKSAEKLEEAKKALAQERDAKKAEELAAQQQLNPMQQPQNAAQQLAKALEQAEMAEKQAQKAQDQLGQKKADLQKLQKEIADKAEKLDQKEAQAEAKKAAEALSKGDLPEAIRDQQKAEDALAKAEPMPGEKGEQGDGTPMPGEAKTPGQLGEAQKKVKELTQSLQKSAEANAAAQAALQQAQATAPKGIKPQLDQAAQQLQKAQQALQGPKPKPGEAAEANAQAEQALGQALGQMMAAQALAAKQQGQPGQEPGQPGQEPGQPGQEPGQQPGQQPGQKPGSQNQQAKEDNQNKGQGDRAPDGKTADGQSILNRVSGEGAFINLPAQQREMILQKIKQQFPPEYAELIRKYTINISGGKPAGGDKK